MPPVVIPVVVRVALGAIGAAAMVHWAVKEARRINKELDRLRTAPAGDSKREELPTLRRDPATGEWRVR